MRPASSSAEAADAMPIKTAAAQIVNRYRILFSILSAYLRSMVKDLGGGRKRRFRQYLKAMIFRGNGL